jgi:ubiquitin-like domain-containing CTD phosphatase 1
MKVTELGILTHTNYTLAFVLDQSAMPTITSVRKGSGTKNTDRVVEKKRHQIKPLRLIWDAFPGHYSHKNTVHVDDVSRNFVMNPQNV